MGHCQGHPPGPRKLAVVELLREQGRVCGARLQPEGSATTQAVRAHCVLNATGTWADALRGQLGQPQRLRPLRGSHLLLPLWRLPVAQAFTLRHPRDRRPVFAFPWEGVALVGTTDLDHAPPVNKEPAITAAEAAYLMEALHFAFPSLQLTQPGELEPVPGTRTLWAELRWAARSEWVRHLDDRLLRRTRLGLLLCDDAQALLPQLRPQCLAELGWDDARWPAECRRYREIILHSHSIPGPMP